MSRPARRESSSAELIARVVDPGIAPLIAIGKIKGPKMDFPASAGRTRGRGAFEAGFEA